MPDLRLQITPENIRISAALISEKYSSDLGNPEYLEKSALIVSLADTLLYMLGESQGVAGAKLSANYIRNITTRLLSIMDAKEAFARFSDELKQALQGQDAVKLFPEEEVNPLYYKIISDIISGVRYILIRGGAWSGKTYAICQALITLATVKHRSVFSIVAPNMPHAKRGVIKDLQNICEKHQIPYSYNKLESTFRFATGTEIQIISADSISQKIGLKREILFINEANFLSEEHFLQLSIRTAKAIIMDLNPFEVPQWLRDKDTLGERRVFDNHLEAHYEIKGEKCARYIVTPYDNKFIPKTALETLEKLEGWQKLAFFEGRYANNMYIKYKTGVPEWVQTCEHKAIGVDFGIYAPSAMIFVVYEKDRKALYAKELLYKSNCSISEMQNVVRNYPNCPLVVDTNDPVARKALQEATRANVIPKATDKLVAYQMFDIAQMEVYIDPASTNLANQLSGVKATDGRLRFPDDDHALDAFRYAAYYLLSTNQFKFGGLKANPIYVD